MSWIRAAYVLSLFSVAVIIAQIANIITVEESTDTNPPVKNSKLSTLISNEDNEVFVFLQVIYRFLYLVMQQSLHILAT